MLRLLFISVLLTLSGIIGVRLVGHPGYVLIATEQFSIESTLWVALSGLLLLFILCFMSIRIIHKILYIPADYKIWSIRKRNTKALDLTTQGLIAYCEGYWDKAKHLLTKAIPNTPTPLIHYLIAARAAQKLDQTKLRDQYLRQAQKNMPNAKIAISLTQAQLQLAHHQPEQALATLRHLRELAPTHPHVLKLLSQLFVQMEDWHQLVELLPYIKKYKAISPEAYETMSEKAYLGAINAAIEQGQYQSVEALVKGVPKNLRENPQLVLCHAKNLIFQKAFDKAQRILQSALQKDHSPEILQLYALLPKTHQKPSVIKALLKKNQNTDLVYLYLAKQALGDGLMGQAQQHLELSIQHHPSQEAYWLLGQLMEKLNDKNSALKYYKLGLQLIH